MKANELQSLLDENGHLHVYLDSGAEAAVSKHDCDVSTNYLIIDSKENYWKIHLDKIEYVEVEPSTLIDAE